ncbi:MAG: hypothetical protein GC204_02095 [Chloroflexi bacterium]|nr:hypothetical protein [Chloroflexota bacterium]
MTESTHIDYLEWQALVVLYRNRERTSSPVKYVGLQATVTRLIKHQPPLATWVGKSSDNQVHITPEGISLYETGS